MNKYYNVSLFIFRRDLRLNDNTGLLAALDQSKNVIPCFIFDPQQVTTKNKYRSMNAIQFMVESLQDLEKQLKKKKGKLYLFYGNSKTILKKLIKQKKIDAVFCNRDYTPFSIKRDTEIRKLCAREKIAFSSHNDLLLTQPEEILTQAGTPYSKFTPYFKKARKQTIPKPNVGKFNNFYTQSISCAESKKIYKKILKKTNPDINVPGGSSNARKILKNLKKFKSYQQQRDFPAIPTTYLSAHNKFGTISIRHVYHEIVKKLGKNHLLIQQLFWRDFFTHVAYNSPFVFGQPFQQKYTKLSWSKNKKDFKAWCQGKTGFPIIDAGMRQMNTTGFMHNRVRMIVASFLTKDLHINWLWGEKYFAQNLEDYDPAVNNGNWQWCASTGCDAQPYFRIFNPWLQQKKYDPKCEYIKQWIPELKNVEPKVIHTWYKNSSFKIKEYPRPIVDHKKESTKTKQQFKKI